MPIRILEGADLPTFIRVSKIKIFGSWIDEEIGIDDENMQSWGGAAVLRELFEPDTVLRLIDDEMASTPINRWHESQTRPPLTVGVPEYYRGSFHAL